MPICHKAWLFVVVAVLLYSTPSMSYAEEKKLPENNAVTLRGLNKVTGRTLKFEVALGTLQRFGGLEILARRCWTAPAEERPESAALLEISEIRQGEEPARLFLGWMFASSPSLSALEHPVYDIAVISCTQKSQDDSQDEKSPAHENKKN